MIYKKFLMCFIICTTIFGCKEAVNKEHVKDISSQELLKIIKSGDVQLIDVRTPAEFNEGYIENAKNINFASPSFAQDITTLDKDKLVIIYCRSGNRSGKSVKDFINAGFTKIYDFNGGILEWKSEGLPLVTDTP